MKCTVYTCLILCGVLFLNASCGGGGQKAKEGSEKKEKAKKEQQAGKEKPEKKAQDLIQIKKGDLKLTEVASPEFPDARLNLTQPLEDKIEPGAVEFKFNVHNYKLGNQTSDADAKNCANSAKGQHIHFIVNNTPYTAHYKPVFSREMEEGNNVVLAFLSRSYHESIKTDAAYVLKQFQTGSGGEKVDLKAPHLFYSRPKGTYTGQDTKKVMLDFYLVNTEIGKDGNKVKVTVNGTNFLIDKWVPYFIEGMPMGENTISIELVDNEGNRVPGPFNFEERTITLEEAPSANR